MRYYPFVFAALVPFAMSVSSVHAANNAGYSDEQFFISGGVSYYGGYDDSAIDDGFGPALSLGYGITDKWAVELLYSRYELNNFSQISFESSSNLLMLNALYSFKESEKLQPFVVFGAGVVDEIDNTLFEESTDKHINLGVGAFYSLPNNFSLRGDIRANYSDDYSQVQPFAYFAVSYRFGGAKQEKPVVIAVQDSDADGVPDTNDSCSNTPANTPVDVKGCAKDDDKDGVVNSADQCPGTPTGTQVDTKGCTTDSDGDGVINEADKCPDTKPGAKVDENGCYAVLKQDITTYMDVAFESSSSTISTLDDAEVNQVAQYMREYPNSIAIVEGHTDNTGAAEFNLQLSQKRADAVKQYLVKRAGIAEDRLESQGFGEAKPVADNKTSEGRRSNRRVSVVIKK